MTKLVDLINQYSTTEMVDRVVELYPNMEKSRKGFIGVCEKLKFLKPETSKMWLMVENRSEDGESWSRVSGYYKGEAYAIEFRPWSSWLGMRIRSDTLKDFSELDIVAHSLWEMTWSGFDEEEIQGTLENLVGLSEAMKEK